MSFSMNSLNVARRVSSEGFAGMRAPDWGRIPHRGMQTPPRDELIKQIKELGIQRAISTSDAELNHISRQLVKLTAQYVSV